IIADRRIDVGARRGHVGETAAEAEADAANSVSALIAQPADRCFNVLDPEIGVILTEVAERLLKFGLDIGTELNPGGETPEDIGRDREVALGRPIIAFLANARVHAED